ncbi:putative histidyl-tRNA synthetase [Babesia bovis T2Bo]|uniref:histidine--tRNA ligase n=1 Tax=Babesia bovis TaxID=5865 RepID=A7AV90_BABBO|nr:putative histidyl-tRNA synthetase [Babesia bovis T2Bo]EDO05716.1 putative histidyl-tRNA synthetase [Babesia bovis T2Bo]|eukprot:XP_001609284.1 histidyl-tRNA synthetase [Babesia bovis T2Bo]
MAKVVLNAVRVLSMDEICSVALSRRVVVLDPELARSLGITDLTSGSRAPGTCKSSGSFLDRLICCALLHRALRRRFGNSGTLVSKFVNALNSDLLCLDNYGQQPAALNDPRLLWALSKVAEISPYELSDEFIRKVAGSLGITETEYTDLCHGQLDLFARVSFICLILSSFSKFSDCVVGLICESLRIPTACFSSVELQKLPHTVTVCRNLVWLTEDSKLISPSAEVDRDLQLSLSSYIMANGEIAELSKSILRICHEMLVGICSSESNGISFMEHSWSLALDSHIARLHRCMKVLAQCYISFVPLLHRKFNSLLAQAKDSSLDIQVIEDTYLDLLEKLKLSLSGVDNAKSSIEAMGELPSICSDLSLACASLCTTILRLQEILKKSDSTQRKAVLGHGNMGVYDYLLEILGPGVYGIQAYKHLNDSFGIPGILDHATRLNAMLLPQNNQIRKLKVPKGTVDILPDDMLVRSIVMDAVKSIFKQHGACEIDTPVFELRETLMGKYGEDQKLIYDLKDTGGEQLCLRYDLTVPFARFLGTNKIEKMKRFHIGKVYRRDEPQIQRGRLREFVQCDLDYAGSYQLMLADAEVVYILIRILRMLCTSTFVIKIGHRVILDAIMTHCGVPAEMHRTICSSIDKLDKEPWSNVREEMISEKGLAVSAVESLKEFVEIKGPISTVVEYLRNKGLVEASGALDEMLLLNQYLASFGAKDSEISFDLSLARGLDYYTGVIFEAVLTGTSVGSVGAGGRYDGLIGMLSGRQVPSVGMSLGIERIMRVLSQNKVSSDVTDVFVCTVGDATMLPERLRICSLLWDAGIAAEFHYNPRANLKKQLDAATVKRAQVAVVVGMSEISEGTVRIKSLNYEEENIKTESESTERPEDLVIGRTEMVHSIKHILGRQGSRHNQLTKTIIPKI